MATETGESIDFTPTWQGILPGLLAVIANGETVEAHKTAEQELRRMADLADRYVDAVKRAGGVIPLDALLKSA